MRVFVLELEDPDGSRIINVYETFGGAQEEAQMTHPLEWERDPQARPHTMKAVDPNHGTYRIYQLPLLP
jgi:hypothetical protein